MPEPDEWDDEVDVDEVEEDFGPGTADYDLSEEHGYAWEAERTDVIPRWMVVSVSLLLVVALVLPSIYIVWRFA